MDGQNRTAPGVNGGGSEEEGANDAWHAPSAPHAPPTKQDFVARHAVKRILEAVDEMGEALRYRVYLEDPNDTMLAVDCDVWQQLVAALGDFLRSRRKP